MAKIVGDILIDLTSGDLAIKDGDLVIGDATEQHQSHLILASKGDYKEKPMIGVDVMNFINDDAPETLLREIRTQLTNDGMEINKLTKKGDKITIDAIYK